MRRMRLLKRSLNLRNVLHSNLHMNINKYSIVYFLGIGGIGMSALARYFNANGKKVFGYDKTNTSLTEALIKEGIQIHFEEREEFVRSSFHENKERVLIIYTPAVPSYHTEFVYFKDNNYDVLKRAEVLGRITESSPTIAIAGTHGKTTTSCMVAHMLHTAGISCTAFLGGISKNFGSNLLLADPLEKKSWFVVEADEYDRSFLQLRPNVSLITSMDADHLDIYGDHQEMQNSYQDFANKLKEDGCLFCAYGLELTSRCTTYSVMEQKADFYVSNLKIENRKYYFDIHYAKGKIQNITSGMSGLHNVENAVGAAAIGVYLGIDPAVIKKSIETFTGVKRRFDVRYSNSSITFIDDYAHHPAELLACIQSVKNMYEGEKIVGIFQPHLFSRTRDFADGFAKSLAHLDELLLMDIYPARELPIEGITSRTILEKMNHPNARIASREEILERIKKMNTGVVLTLGAGDIDTLLDPINSILLKGSYE